MRVKVIDARSPESLEHQLQQLLGDIPFGSADVRMVGGWEAVVLFDESAGESKVADWSKAKRRLLDQILQAVKMGILRDREDRS